MPTGATVPARSRRRQRTAARCARCCVGLGLARGHAAPVPRPRRPRPRRPAGRRGIDARPTRWRPRSRCCARRCCPACCGRRLQRVAPPRRAWRSSRSATCSCRPPGGQDCPTSASSSAWCWPGATPRPRSGSGACWSSALGVADAGVDRPTGPPACTPTRAASVARRRRRRRRGRRDRPGRARPLTASASGWPGSRSTSTALLACPAATGAYRADQPLPVAATSTWPSWSPTRCRPAPVGDAIAGHGRRAARRRPSCSTSSAAAPWPTVAAASPTDCDCRPSTAPSPTTDVGRHARARHRRGAEPRPAPPSAPGSFHVAVLRPTPALPVTPRACFRTRDVTGTTMLGAISG